MKQIWERLHLAPAVHMMKRCFHENSQNSQTILVEKNIEETKQFRTKMGPFDSRSFAN